MSSSSDEVVWVFQSICNTSERLIACLHIYGQIHLFTEPICMALYRHLPSKHPLNELLKYHCRGLITANTIGAPPLFWPKGYMDRLSAIGRQGAMLLIIRGYQTLDWNNADLLFDMKVNSIPHTFRKLNWYLCPAITKERLYKWVL